MVLLPNTWKCCWANIFVLSVNIKFKPTSAESSPQLSREVTLYELEDGWLAEMVIIIEDTRNTARALLRVLTVGTNSTQKTCIFLHCGPTPLSHAFQARISGANTQKTPFNQTVQKEKRERQTESQKGLKFNIQLINHTKTNVNRKLTIIKVE